MDHFDAKFQVEGMFRHQPFSLFPKLDIMAFHVVLNSGGMFVHFVTKHAFDRQTDGRTEGDRKSIAKTALSIAVAR